MIHRLKEYILDNWKDLIGDQPPLKRLSYILLTNKDTRSFFVTLLVFLKGGNFPVLSVKIPRFPGEDAPLITGFNNLKEIRRSLPNSLRDALPIPISMVHLGGRSVVFERPFPGITLSLSIKIAHGDISQPFIDKKFEIVGDWLSAFIKETTRKRVFVNHERIQRYVMGILEDYSNFFLTSTKERDFLNYLTKLMDTLSTHQIPLSFIHGDLTPHNISFNDGRLCVFNWEHSRDFSCSLYDIFDFFTYVTFMIFHNRFHPINPLRGVFTFGGRKQPLRKFVQKVMENSDINLKLMEFFYPVYLMEKAVSQRNVNGNIWQQTLFFFLENRNKFHF